ncbi:MAG: hypothetical protein GTO71_10190, partial [Woeseiaceae bacterium]|nr:hypothetical protein [Woeseiaceae bacterium]NIP21444.1 hypothetical protein [Woeseiaceae bacterium]
MSPKPVLIACSLLFASGALAQDEQSCQTSLGRALAVDSPLREIVLDNPETIQLEAGAF